MLCTLPIYSLCKRVVLYQYSAGLFDAGHALQSQTAQGERVKTDARITLLTGNRNKIVLLLLLGFALGCTIFILSFVLLFHEETFVFMKKLRFLCQDTQNDVKRSEKWFKKKN